MENSGETLLKGLGIQAARQNWVFKGKYYLLAIGIAKYKFWEALNNPVKDVNDLVDCLVNDYQFDQENITLLLDEDATEKAILSAFRSMQEKVTENDNLLVYYSGHGSLDAVTDTAYWIPCDAEQGADNAYQFIDTAIIAHRLTKIKSLHTFLAIDACFSGSFLTTTMKGGNDLSNRKLLAYERRKSRSVLTSGGNTLVSDGKAGENSPFAMGILSFLRTCDDSLVRVADLVDSVKKYMAVNSDQLPENGPVRGSGDDAGEMFLRRRGVIEEIPVPSSPLGMAIGTTHPLSNEEIEDQDWEETKQTRTYLAVKEFLSEYPNGKYVNEAKAIKAQLEEATYREVREKATYRLYQQFITDFSDSRYVKEISSEMKRIDDKAFRTIKLRMNFFNSLAEGRSKMEILEEIKKMCRDYLVQFPGSEHNMEIRKIMNDLLIANQGNT
jgi:hypothetical protein